MPSLRSLRPAQREFLGLVTRATSANPFSDEFDRLQSEITGCPPSAPAGKIARQMVVRWDDQLRQLHEAGIGNYTQMEGEDRELLRYACLYEIYHRFLPAFDELIATQLAAGERSVPVSFAGKALTLFARRGFRPDEARRHFAIMYQVRRAFFFIDHGLTGRSESMKQLRRHLWNNVFTHDIRHYERHLCGRMEDFSTMLLGETGSGKGAAAAAIGQSGFIPFDERKGQFTESFARSFLAINLSQYPETLLESELFGHQKGAFTGAIDAHEGVLARCSPHGSIFLDEIGEVTTPVQIKLLQVLQERTFSPVGSHEKRRFRGRVIAATNRRLEERRASGQFRDDFYYRLCSDVIIVPPLRQRMEEVPAERDELVAQLLRRMFGERVPEFEAMVNTALNRSPGKNYPWPGNVRELEQAVRRILLTRHYDGDHRGVAPDLAGRLQTSLADGQLSADELLAGYCRLLYERHGTYEEVARRTRLDRRTVKAYLEKK